MPHAQALFRIHLPREYIDTHMTENARARLRKIREYLAHDSTLVRGAAEFALAAVGRALYAIPSVRDKGFGAIAKAHRLDGPLGLDASVERFLRREIGTPRFEDLQRRHITRSGEANDIAARFSQDPRKMLRSMALVLKAAEANEKGIVNLVYSYAFPVFDKLFDLDAMSENYHIVLEPSWSGYCTLDILALVGRGFPVFVQAYEPRETKFLRSLASNLVPVPIAANWWVDPRKFRPLPTIKKDADVIMVAAWAPYKRHYRLFEALARAKESGLELRAILVGYPLEGYDQHSIRELAEHYGVMDLIEIHDSISPDDVNALFNRAFVNVVWSRKEGVNRAIIEGMFAGTPCLLRRGFNFGYEYEYVNAATGQFCGENELFQVLARASEDYARMDANRWVEDNMTPQVALSRLNECIAGVARTAGENWSPEKAVAKVNYLAGQDYWDQSDHERFGADYSRLESFIRS